MFKNAFKGNTNSKHHRFADFSYFWWIKSGHVFFFFWATLGSNRQYAHLLQVFLGCLPHGNLICGKLLLLSVEGSDFRRQLSTIGEELCVYYVIIWYIYIFRVYIYTYIMDKLYYSILARTSTKKYIDDIIHFHPTGHIPKIPTSGKQQKVIYQRG